MFDYQYNKIKNNYFFCVKICFCIKKKMYLYFIKIWGDLWVGTFFDILEEKKTKKKHNNNNNNLKVKNHEKLQQTIRQIH